MLMESCDVIFGEKLVRIISTTGFFIYLKTQYFQKKRLSCAEQLNAKHRTSGLQAPQGLPCFRCGIASVEVHEDGAGADETGPQGEAGLHLAAITRQGTWRQNQGWLDGWDVDQMHLAQLQDEAIGPILLHYEEDPEKPDWTALSHLPAGSKEIWSNWQNLDVKDGLMFRKFYNNKAKKNSWQLMVPKAKQKEVFQHLYEHNTGGHLGTERTTHKISQAFYWPNMRQVIQEVSK